MIVLGAACPSGISPRIEEKKRGSKFTNKTILWWECLQVSFISTPK